jgi:hypothetical protein
VAAASHLGETCLQAEHTARTSEQAVNTLCIAQKRCYYFLEQLLPGTLLLHPHIYLKSLPACTHNIHDTCQQAPHTMTSCKNRLLQELLLLRTWITPASWREGQRAPATPKVRPGGPVSPKVPWGTAMVVEATTAAPKRAPTAKPWPIRARRPAALLHVHPAGYERAYSSLDSEDGTVAEPR